MSDALDVITCAIERSPGLPARHIAEVIENDLVNARLLPDPEDVDPDPIRQRAADAEHRAWVAEIEVARLNAEVVKLANVRAILPRNPPVLGGRATDEQAAYLHGQRSVWRQIRNALKGSE